MILTSAKASPGGWSVAQLLEQILAPLGSFFRVEVFFHDYLEQPQKQAAVQGRSLRQVSLLVLTQALEAQQHRLQVALAQKVQQLQHQNGHIIPALVAAILGQQQHLQRYLPLPG